VKTCAKKIAVLVVILAALAGVISFVIWFSNHGFSAREKPSWVETVLARQARKTATPAGAKELKNPQPKARLRWTKNRRRPNRPDR